MAYTKLCVYCKVVRLEGYNSEERKYYEQGTKQLHTRERCNEAKNRSGAGSTPAQDQKTNDIKAAQEERRQQHRELITAMQNLTRAIIRDIAIHEHADAADIEDSIGFDQSREDKFNFQDEVV